METTLESFRYIRDPPSLLILNQLLLPHTTKYESALSIYDGHSAIKEMKVRGAPAIGIVAALSLAVDLQLRLQNVENNNSFENIASLVEFIHTSINYLKTARPTAVNLSRALEDLWSVTIENAKIAHTTRQVIEAVVTRAENMLLDDVKDNKNIGRYGAEFLLQNAQNFEMEGKIKVLTHCNTGSLATAGYGTALGIIRSLHHRQKLSHAYCTETRPYNQGSRLTAYELLHDNMPSTLICDSMASALLSKNQVAAIIVGADRVARNGDTANKIGTYQLAITAKYHGVMFIVAAPSTSIDLEINSGENIIIEERPQEEMISVSGVQESTENTIKELQRGLMAKMNLIWHNFCYHQGQFFAMIFNKLFSLIQYHL
ncbi:hypothetical protein G9A89_004798 [Geosiphon pyriformis]|nr:hypothetical protein G9A89_004798 [Geosiphon pyriformis]